MLFSTCSTLIYCVNRQVTWAPCVKLSVHRTGSYLSTLCQDNVLYRDTELS